MEEQFRNRSREAPSPSGGLGSIFDPSPGAQIVTVAAGPHHEQLPVANLTVGAIRSRYRDRFDIDPRSGASLDGRNVGDEEVVRAGQILTFEHHVGEKGSLLRSQLLLETPEQQAPAQLTIEGELARTVTPEGHERSLPLASLWEQARPRMLGTGEQVLPDGCKTIRSRGRALICVFQIPPRVHNLKWIRSDSKRPYGEGATYRMVRISLPYLVVMEVFHPGPTGRLTLSKHAECFFLQKPMQSLDDALLFPALLNCSKFDPPEGKPLAWICSQYLDRSFDREEDEGKRLNLAHRAMLRCLLETGFNLSSEHHEGNSWFRASAQVDKRIGSIEAWEAATNKDPLFALDVSWLPTGLTVRQMTERMFDLIPAAQTMELTAPNLVRIILNQRRRSLNQ